MLMNSVTFTLDQTCNPFSIDGPADLVNISLGKFANEGPRNFFLGHWMGENYDSNLKMNVQSMVHDC